jgi:putative component of membrane protein insertase Oxa1/YidC/SpoIIIJ protein YidD
MPIDKWYLGLMTKIERDLRLSVSPKKWLGVGCRFTPTCSRYAEGAVRRDGALVGTARAVWRIARCGPWTPAGTHDPP